MAATSSAPVPGRRSPVHKLHVAAGARFAPFAGWEMPLEYTGSGTLAEHAAVRDAVGLFDVSHLGTVVIRGTGAAAHVDTVLSNSLARIVPGQAQYTLCLTEAGGVVDDLIVYLVGPDELLLVPNAANAAEVVRRLRLHAPASVQVEDRHDDIAVLAVQGPRSREVMAAVGLPHGHAYMSFATVTDPTAAASRETDEPTVVCRTGYTGEHGYEVLVPAAAAGALWRRLAVAVEDVGGRPAGLGARDTLRTEMGYPLHGSDIDTGVSPLQARLGFALGWDGPDFVGREALLREKAAGPVRTAVGLLALGRGVPRAGMSVHLAPGEGPLGEPMGRTTSGTFSPTLRQGVALALVDSAAGVGVGDTVALDVRGRVLRCEVVRPPFVPAHVRD